MNNKKHYKKVIKEYFLRCKDSYELCELTKERIDYYSDRWGYDGMRFWIIRQMIDEIERRWMKEKGDKK